jgi:hypothetical protein
MTRSDHWSWPCLLSLGFLTACSGNGGDASSGGGGTSTDSHSGGGGSTGGTGGTTTPTLPMECPSLALSGAACLVPAAGFAADPPATLELTATVTEIGEGAPPGECDTSPARFLYPMASAKWARLEDDMQQEWVIAFDVPTLAAGFNGHVAVGDAVQVSMTWVKDIGGLGTEFVVGDLTLSKGGAIVAYVSENKAPAWVTRGDAICQTSEGCCGYTSFDMQAEVQGQEGSVPAAQTAEIGGLAITNLAWQDIEDMGCCNYAPTEPIGITAAALP